MAARARRSPTVDRWDLNAILLHHRTRFFQAADLAARSLERDPRAALALLGTLAWAASPFVAEDEEEQAGLAFGGALASQLTEAGGASLPALARVERELAARHDRLVDAIWSQLVAQGRTEDSPAAVNEFVWRRLFPEVEYGLSWAELVERLRVALAE